MAENSANKLLTPANIVTTIRIILIPVFVFLLLAPWPSWLSDPVIAQIAKPWVAAAVFALLALTDSLDGYLARSRNEVTNLGKFLDPLADKILVTAALLALIELGKLPAWIALIIIGRDFLVSGLRMVASAEHQVIAASNIGKSKTTLQIIAMIMFIVKGNAAITELSVRLSFIFDLLSWTVMAVALFLTLLSMLDYFHKSASVLGLPLHGLKSRRGRRDGRDGAAGHVGRGGDVEQGGRAEYVDKTGPVGQAENAVPAGQVEQGGQAGGAEDSEQAGQAEKTERGKDDSNGKT